MPSCILSRLAWTGWFAFCPGTVSRRAQDGVTRDKAILQGVSVSGTSRPEVDTSSGFRGYMPEVAWEGHSLEYLLSPGCCFPPPGSLLPGTGHGTQVTTQRGQDLGWDLRPGVYPHRRSPPTFQRLLDWVKGLHPATGPQGKGEQEGDSPSAGSQRLEPSPQDSVNKKNHVPIRQASDSPQRPQKGLLLCPRVPDQLDPKGSLWGPNSFQGLAK